MGGVAVESNKDIEVWLLYKEFEGYLVSNYGNVISLKKGQVKKLTQQVSKSGYNFYQFTENGVSYGRRGGRLVGELFVEKPSHISESEKQINHLHQSSVYLCLKGKQKSTKGWMFKEISDSSVPLNSVSKRALLPKGMSIKIK